MIDEFEVIEVPADASEALEQMGTKPKFWFSQEKLGKCLYKKARLGSGEDWAEKTAAELCELIGLPHAKYELAICNGEPGTVTPTFVPDNMGLVHGNEILSGILPNYPLPESGSRRYSRVPNHTLEAVLLVMSVPSIELPIGWSPPTGIRTAADVFVGYLLLDTWIGNQDRHHENWGLLLKRKTATELRATWFLAPTYDHASSLGRNEKDEKRKKKLTTKDRGNSMEAYVERCFSALFLREEDVSPLKTLDAFRLAGDKRPAAMKIWFDSLADVTSADTRLIFERIPRDRISESAIEFALKMLELNQGRLLKLREEPA
jgi:hypothetical protein